ncbi:hypothetical protein ACGFX4_09080 [Kitasatospora sp. NPDC048365]|uniref:hypothetical protein n=1 Tax=Kitasatospora sp. NPDC048365 TaxID=3364050 RepID=UPI00372032B5
MARITFDPAEAEGLRTAAREAFTDGTPALAYTLEKLAAEGIDLESCIPWDGLRVELGLPEDDGVADVA